MAGESADGTKGVPIVLRLVLAVALAAAILVVVTPALEDARTTRTERLTARELGRIRTAAETLAGEESPGARRTLTVSLPGESPTTAPLAFASVGGIPNRSAAGPPSNLTDTADRDLLAYRVGGGSTGVRSGDSTAVRTGGSTAIRRIGVDLRVVRNDEVAASDSRALVLLGGETYRLTLRLMRIRGRLRVVVGVGDSSGASRRGKPPPNSVHH